MFIFGRVRYVNVFLTGVNTVCMGCVLIIISKAHWPCFYANMGQSTPRTCANASLERLKGRFMRGSIPEPSLFDDAISTRIIRAGYCLFVC